MKYGGKETFTGNEVNDCYLQVLLEAALSQDISYLDGLVIDG